MFMELLISFENGIKEETEFMGFKKGGLTRKRYRIIRQNLFGTAVHSPYGYTIAKFADYSIRLDIQKLPVLEIYRKGKNIFHKEFTSLEAVYWY